MHYLGKNIKLLRKNKGLTQENLANKLNVNRSVIGAYEEGRVEPKLQTIITLSGYFGVNMDKLVNTDLEKAGTNEPQVDVKGEKLRVLPVIVDKNTQEERSVLVPVKASAGYTEGYGDIDYIEKLPHFDMPFPELPGQRSYRLFQIKGESMLPIPPGAYIICEFMQNWENIKNEECYVLVTKDEGVVYKRLLNNLQMGELVLKSDNPEFEPYEIKVDQVLEVWKALGFTSFKLPEAKQLQSQIDVLTTSIMQMKDEIDRLKRRVR